MASGAWRCARCRQMCVQSERNFFNGHNCKELILTKDNAFVRVNQSINGHNCR